MIEKGSILVICLASGVRYGYLKAKKYLRERQYVDRGLIPKIDKLYRLDQIISNMASNYAPMMSNLLNNFTDFYKESYLKDVSEDALPYYFFSFVRHMAVHNNAVMDEKLIKYDKMKNLVWFLTDPESRTPLNKRKVILLTANVNDIKSGSQRDFQGIVTILASMKMLKESIHNGSLKGVVVIASVSYGQHSSSHIFNGVQFHPDVIIICEPTGTDKGPLGFAIAQKGKIDVNIHIGGDPHVESEKRMRIIDESRVANICHHKDPFLGKGFLTQIPNKSGGSSDIRFRRVLTYGECTRDAFGEIRAFPTLDDHPDKEQNVSCEAFVTPWKTEKHSKPVVAISEAYRRTVSPWADSSNISDNLPRRYPYYTERINIDSNTGFPRGSRIPRGKEWVSQRDGSVNPPLIAFGAGWARGDDCSIVEEQLVASSSVITRFPSLFKDSFRGEDSNPDNTQL